MNTFDIKRAQEQAMLEQQANAEFNAALQKQTFDLMISKEYVEWYDIAIRSLYFTSPADLRISMKGFDKLFEVEEDKHHKKITLFNMAMLVNNFEQRNAWELEVDMEEYRRLLRINFKLSQDWEKATTAIKESIETKLKIMKGGNVGMQLIKAQA